MRIQLEARRLFSARKHELRLRNVDRLKRSLRADKPREIVRKPLVARLLSQRVQLKALVFLGKLLRNLIVDGLDLQRPSVRIFGNVFPIQTDKVIKNLTNST